MQPFLEVCRIFAEFDYFLSEFGESFLFPSVNPDTYSLSFSECHSQNIIAQQVNFSGTATSKLQVYAADYHLFMIIMRDGDGTF